ncbi:MBL fold metallo-hydrolase [Polaromonas sp.]|uniref:MBL fold metallo-hydrolase n=1 Tax=Polaromonas sp. TaxID=1869339 RepID=UPI003BB5632C
MSVKVEQLGQAGFRICFGEIVLFIDPYLSNRVEEIEGPKLRRLVPIKYAPHKVADASYVLISHEHMDHCDVDTLIPISKSSLLCKFIGPRNVINYLLQQGVAEENLITANSETIVLDDGIVIYPVPAAHKEIEIDSDGFYRYLGYVICYEGKRYLHTGDTCVNTVMVERIREIGPIDVAFLPVNECNFYRDKAGIIGNMSIREAFLMAQELDAKIVVPMHYDMFESNQAYQEEIELIYRRTNPDFKLQIDSSKLAS